MMNRARTSTLSHTAGLLGGLCLLLTVATGAVAQDRGSAPALELSFTEMDTLSLPGDGFVTGLTWMGPDTLVVLSDLPDTLSESGDREVRLVFSSPYGEIYFQEDFTGVLDRGLAYDGEFLYSCGDANDGSSILYQIETDTLRVAEAFDVPGHRPVGMCYDGRFVWISDRDSGRIDRFDPEVGEISRSVIAPGFSPFGLTWDGRHMWVTDSGSGRLYRLSGSRRTWTATAMTESFLYRGMDVHLLHDGSFFWYIPAGQKFAVRILFQ